jgi:hypothetical protein
MPYVRVDRHDAMRALLARATAGPAISMAVVHPVGASSLLAALAAAKAGLILPVLIGPAARIGAIAAAEAADIATYRLLDMPDAPASAAKAVAMA